MLYIPSSFLHIQIGFVIHDSCFLNVSICYIFVLLFYLLGAITPKQFLINTQLRGIDHVDCMYEGVLRTIKTIN